MSPRLTALALAVVIATAPGCSAIAARQQVESFQAHIAKNDESWRAAQWRLVKMCPPQPTTHEAYLQGVAVRKAGGPDPFNGCDARLMKLTNGPQTDDWRLLWFPNYRTIVAVHDEELRRRVKPKVYDEYALEITRALAERADRGEITSEQLRAAFNESWTWLFRRMQDERLLLEDAVRAAEAADAQALNALATGLAAAATIGLVGLAVVAASRPVPPPAPIVCTVLTSRGIGFVTCH
jgi:hypothetical protein